MFEALKLVLKNNNYFCRGIYYSHQIQSYEIHIKSMHAAFVMVYFEIEFCKDMNKIFRFLDGCYIPVDKTVKDSLKGFEILSTILYL